MPSTVFAMRSDRPCYPALLLRRCGLVSFRVQLAASRRDIASPALADGSGQVTPMQDRLKVLDPFARARSERRLRKRIEEDQIYLRTQGREHLHQTMGIVRRIVHLGEHHVLEGDAPPTLVSQRLASVDQRP